MGAVFLTSASLETVLKIAFFQGHPRNPEQHRRIEFHEDWVVGGKKGSLGAR